MALVGNWAPVAEFASHIEYHYTVDSQEERNLKKSNLNNIIRFYISYGEFSVIISSQQQTSADLHTADNSITVDGPFTTTRFRIPYFNGLAGSRRDDVLGVGV